MPMIEQIKAGGSHSEVGFAIGQHFAEQIHRSLDAYRLLQERLLPYHRTPEGQARYQELVSLHQARYPSYFAELEGIAQGSGRPLEDLFLTNLRGEYRTFLRGAEVQGCSDCALVTDHAASLTDNAASLTNNAASLTNNAASLTNNAASLTNNAALIGHNEDGSPTFRGNMYVVHARIEGKPAFTALSYPGFLCGNAFGFNAEGICFSIDHVQPRNGGVGVGRHFIARSLLEARSLDDAIERVTVPERASGFSYTIGSIPERRVLVVEVAPDDHHVREVRGAYFHTNHYRELAEVDQIIHPSSRARVERAGAMMKENPPRSTAEVLAILGDQTDEPYPIYRTATAPDRSATLCTALFDLDARQLRIYTGHPTQAPSEFIALAM